jgi:hypothetical protein
MPMFNYSPRIEHFFMPGILCTIGEALRHYNLAILGWTFYGLGAGALLMIIVTVGFEIAREMRSSDPERAQVDASTLRTEPTITHVSVTEGTNTKLINLPANEKQLEALAVGVLHHGRSLSQREWTGAGRPFSINQFNALRDEMQRRGLLHLVSEKDPRQGVALNRVGVAMLSKFLPSPTVQTLVSESADR